MSMYYNPQLVRLLMEERIREAARARRARPPEEPEMPAARRAFRVPFLGRRPAQVSATACTCS
jgi:hypothetical protein